jgi:UDP-N-acetylmuramate dehydrogenase
MSLAISDFQKGVNLAKHTSWLIGGLADFYFEPKTILELVESQNLAQKNSLPITVLGGGSNVLISDKGIRGLVISLSKLSGIEILDETNPLTFWALAGTSKSQLLKIFLKQKLSAACFLAGIPGQVGGGVVMNAGIGENIKLREFSEITKAIEVLRPDSKLEIIESKKLNWAYRHCDGWKPGIITRVKIECEMAPDQNVPLLVKELNQKRLKKQPLEWPSCGSVFRNPLPHHAGQLIESVGLKGRAIGGAQISEKHANFIINCGGAKATDIKALIELCIVTVRNQYSIKLQTEVVYLGQI